ncbi:MAG: 3-hydroxyacyl-CoA dehydrogenase [Candidatus Obscuribacterales bacterium]|nr:3-hydroxyacyl-CoA dehydrogenase [Candidatus Obscuribacterales bacterium]
MKVVRAAVVGAGAMGSGIACVLSQCGIEVLLKDVEQTAVDRGLGNIKRMYDSRVKKGLNSQEEADKLFGLVKGTTSYDDFKNVDLVIEAAFEEISVKLDIFKTLDAICPKKAILATNTSALSVSEIAAATSRPDKVLGMHFFNPAQFMKLVEVIPGVHTAEETVKTAMDLCREMQKTPVKVEECPGFLVNRVLFTYMNEALYVLQEGTATIEEIDAKAVEHGLPMGPFALFDMTGIDVCAHVTQFLYEQYGERFAPSPLLAKMVKAKQLGQKTGAGFFMHDKGVPAKGEAKVVNAKVTELVAEANKEKALPKAEKFDGLRIILPMLNEAIYCLQEGVVDVKDIDLAMANGCGFKKGLVELADSKGLAFCLDELKAYSKVDAERFRPSWLLSKLVAAKMTKLSDFGKKPAPVC